mmetsp:Transcript_24347/g.70026  ORF Transcript_24347/g.70026 Transcript_24347/m.70026 type:complete len:239 (+) Transcript_24347:100-816(+)
MIGMVVIATGTATATIHVIILSFSIIATQYRSRRHGADSGFLIRLDYNLQTRQRDQYRQSGYCYEEAKEVSMIPFSNTIPNPWTMMIEFADAYVATVAMFGPRRSEDVAGRAVAISQWSADRRAVVGNWRLYWTRYARNDAGVGCSRRPESYKSNDCQYPTANGGPRLRRPVIWYMFNQMRHHNDVIECHRYDEKGIGEEKERGITAQHDFPLAQEVMIAHPTLRRPEGRCRFEPSLL